MVPWGLNILDSGYSVKFGYRNNSLAKRKTFKEKLYQELGLVSFEKRRWCQKLCYSYQTFTSSLRNRWLTLLLYLADHN